MIRWKIFFCDLFDNEYTINIYDDNYTGTTPTIVKGGANVFEVQEDASEDVLTPIRTSSGNINIVCDRDTWLSIINNGSRVELFSGTSRKWLGYVTKSAYNGNVFEPVTEYAIPVHCVLSHLQSAFFIVSPYDSPTFASLLVEAFDKCNAVMPDNVVWSKNLNRYPDFLACRFQRSNYFSNDNKEVDGEYVCEVTYLEVIRQICIYFGITLCADGECLYFLLPEQGVTFYEGEAYELSLVEEGGKQAMSHVSTLISTEDALEDLQFLSASNQESVLPPFKSVKVTGAYNAYEDFDAQYPQEVVDDWINNHITEIEHVDNTQYRLYRRKFTEPTPTQDPEFPEQRHDVVTYENDLVQLRLYDWLDFYNEHYAYITSRDFCLLTDVANKIDYEWRNKLTFVMAGSYSDYPVMAINSKRAISLGANSGAINLHYRISRDLNSFYDGGVLSADDWLWELSVGDMYWDGTQWSDTPSTFAVGWKLVTGQIINECETNRTLGDGYDGIKGLVIPIPQNMYGKVSLRLFCPDGTTAPTPVYYFEELSLSYVRKNQTPGGKPIEQESEYTVMEILSNKDLEEYTQSCDFASFGGVNGYGVVLAYDGQPLSRLSYGSENEAPEVMRKNFVKAMRSSPASMLELDVKNNASLANRWEQIADGEYFPAYLPLSVEHKWRDGLMKVKLIQIQ